MDRSPERDARDLARLCQQNARLNADVDFHRRQIRRARQSSTIKQAGAVPPVPFELADPRRKPKEGSKVLPDLTPPLSLAHKMGAAIGAELRAMAIEARALIRSLMKKPDVASAMDTVTDDAQVRTAALQAKWRQRFATLAETLSKRMISGVLSQSTAQLNMGLKGLAGQLEIQSTLQSPRMRAIVEAAAQASVGLITRIPERFLGGVQTALMTAITNGNGLEDLVPYLTKKYKGDARHAHLVALDQIRKVTESVNSTRIRSLGAEEYVWIHTGGERYPRKLHQSYSGKTFRYDDPPIIDERTGERGGPGVAINCRCRARPVLNFTKMREVS